MVRFIEPDDLDFLMSPGGLTFGETRRKTRKTEEEANNWKERKTRENSDFFPVKRREECSDKPAFRRHHHRHSQNEEDGD